MTVTTEEPVLVIAHLPFDTPIRLRYELNPIECYMHSDSRRDLFFPCGSGFFAECVGCKRHMLKQKMRLFYGYDGSRTLWVYAVPRVIWDEMKNYYLGADFKLTGTVGDWQLEIGEPYVVEFPSGLPPIHEALDTAYQAAMAAYEKEN